MCRWAGSALVQIMACRLDGAKPLSEPMLTYCQLDPKEHISMRFHLKFIYSHSRKCVWKCRLRNGGHFDQGEMSLQSSVCWVSMWGQPQFPICQVKTVVLFTKEVNLRLVKCPLVFNGRLANRGVTSLVKEATGLNTRGEECIFW